MASLLTPVTLLAEFVAALAVAFSIAAPAHRIWPPPRSRTWQTWAMGVLFVASALGVIAIGLLDWGSWRLAPWLRWTVGLPLWLAGNILAVWGMAALGPARTHGGEGALVRRGPYRFSRNPQYAGFIAGLIGWPLVSGATLALPVAWAGVVACALAPWAEESWLGERYGAQYAAYRRSVPRFLGLPARHTRASASRQAHAQRTGGPEPLPAPTAQDSPPPAVAAPGASRRTRRADGLASLVPKEMRTVELARRAGGEGEEIVQAMIDDDGALRVFRTASTPGVRETKATATVAAEDLNRLLEALLLDASTPQEADGLSQADRDALLLRLVRRAWAGDMRAVETFTAFARVRSIEVDRFGWP